VSERKKKEKFRSLGISKKRQLIARLILTLSVQKELLKSTKEISETKKN
jgi:hypothetical protein|tara:strand:+ start:430 stop:576 length:147 start_codon:yes stop_codon:yes gene_type:complete